VAGLPWSTAVVREALRLYPEFWPDPAGFDPVRFLPASSPGQEAASGRLELGPVPFAYLPFGGGRRACVGQAFAELEMTLVLASIAQRYRLELTASGLPRPVAGITLRPARSLPMRLVRRH
jgi:cytochrome P450